MMELQNKAKKQKKGYGKIAALSVQVCIVNRSKPHLDFKDLKFSL